MGESQGGCERRIEVVVKMNKRKKAGSVGGQIRSGMGGRGVGWGLVEEEGVGW